MRQGNNFFTWRQAILKSDLSSSQKLVALVISTYMNDHGEGAYPTQATIAADASINIKTVQRASIELEELGWIKRTPHGFGDQRWKTFDYVIAFPSASKARDRESLPLDEKGGDTESPPSEKVATLCPEGSDTVSERLRHCVQKVATQSRTISPENSPMNSPEKKASADDPPAPVKNSYQSWKPDQQTLDLIKARGWRLDPTWLAEFRIHAEDKRIPPNELRKSFVNWLKYERVNDQNLKGRAQRNHLQPETPARAKREPEFQLDKPTSMKELLGGITS